MGTAVPVRSGASPPRRSSEHANTYAKCWVAPSTIAALHPPVSKFRYPARYFPLRLHEELYAPMIFIILECGISTTILKDTGLPSIYADLEHFGMDRICWTIQENNFP